MDHNEEMFHDALDRVCTAAGVCWDGPADNAADDVIAEIATLRGYADEARLWAEVEAWIDKFSIPGPMGGERHVFFSLAQSVTRACDFDNRASKFRYQASIRFKSGGVSAFGSTRRDALRALIDRLQKLAGGGVA